MSLFLWVSNLGELSWKPLTWDPSLSCSQEFTWGLSQEDVCIKGEDVLLSSFIATEDLRSLTGCQPPISVPCLMSLSP